MVASLAAIFGLSFVSALSGALSPGPLFTYTVVSTLRSPRRGYLVGAQVILGHALLEIGVMALILSGLSFILVSPLAVKIIGLAGSGFLLLLAALLVRDALSGKTLLPAVVDNSASRPAPQTGGAYLLRNPVLGGILISMSNPYWWIWWATIGLLFMLEHQVSLANPPALAAFYLGHESADLAWYASVSVLVFFSRRLLTERIYRVILMACALVMAGFAVYLAVSALLYQPAA
jgi:threonine/homoserine/homoserine lactone efflux protein